MPRLTLRTLLHLRGWFSNGHTPYKPRIANHWHNDAMPNIASALRDEILRLSRREVRSSTETLRRAVVSYRSEIARLKRRVADLERKEKSSARAPVRSVPATDQESDGQQRWRSAGFAQHRQRLGLSAADCGKLLGVSGLTVYNWESGKARPRAAYMPAIAQLRRMGKREAAGQLEKLAV